MTSRLDIVNKPNVYGWSAIVDFNINNTGGFTELGEGKASLLWARDLVLTIEPRKVGPILSGAGAKGYRMTVEATDTASHAERLGLGLAHSLLAIAIKRSWGMSLSWPDQPLPCRVVDRTASRGFSSRGFLTSSSRIDTKGFVEELETEFDDNVSYNVLLSMELCASSRFENDNRAKLIMLVSAFEALSKQQDLSSEVGTTVEELKIVVSQADIDGSLRDSLIGQVEQLTRESIRRALKRFLKEMGLDESDIKFVESAYSARSKIVHEGRRVPELDSMTSKLDQILKTIYQELLISE
jgi:hypothetical protein